MIIASCIRESTGISVYKITNSSSKNIKIGFYYKNNGKLRDSILLKPNDVKQYHDTDEGNPPHPSPMEFHTNSASVIFNDSVSVIHTYYPTCKLKRSLFFTWCWSGKELKRAKRSVTYEYEYIFTDEDYKEAVEQSGLSKE